MLSTHSTDKAASRSSGPEDELAAIRHSVDHAAHLLPAQGPITAFVHHNTLHAFEELEFDQAVRKGARVFGCHPYLTEAAYRQMLISGRISTEDIEAVLHEQLGDRSDDLLGFLGTRFHLYRAILKYPLHDGPKEDLRWVINESRALDEFHADAPVAIREQFVGQTRQWVMRDFRNGQLKIDSDTAETDPDAAHSSKRLDAGLLADLSELLKLFGQQHIESWSDQQWESFTLHLLWKISEHGVRQSGIQDDYSFEGIRPRDWLLELTGQDADERVNSLLIRFCAAFIDQGFGNWSLPNRDLGFFRCFLSVYRQRLLATEPWQKGLAAELARLADDGIEPDECIRESLNLLGVQPDQYDDFIGASLLSLPGFGGMLWQLETRGDRVSRAVPAGTLLEYVAVRLVLQRFSVRQLARDEMQFTGNLDTLRPMIETRLRERHHRRSSLRKRVAFRVFEIAQLLGWKPKMLARLRPLEWKQAIDELDRFTGTERRKIYHLAYERKFYTQALDAIIVHSTRVRQNSSDSSESRLVARPAFQTACCIDDREESFRRHLEEVAPECETFAVAGFFATPMYYRGAADAHYTPLCPVTIKPSHYVREEVVYSLKEQDSKRRRARQTLGTVTHRVHLGSRTFTGGWFGSALIGSLATFPLVARTLFPRLTAQVRSRLGGLVQPPAMTRLTLERKGEKPGPTPEGLGFSVPEMARTVETVLRDIGLTSNLSRVIIIIGHGSSSLNNPHEAAYDCGACAGARGGPNARALSQMANDPRVRKLVADNGLVIPDDTVFIGSFHNTCDDSVTYFDLDRLPASHREEYEHAAESIDVARKRSAHERCRRFETAPLNLSFDNALKHVEGRSQDLSQVRPELGHATNAVTLVGRRSWSRGLFLDRRAFLQSYDPQQDDEASSILARILSAVIPVCGGISLEYFFSFVDPAGYGCGSKLPHNITSLLGVMNGAASDLRTGLPWQMVEIHEPIRQLFVIETTPESMKRIIAGNDAIGRLCNGNWVKLAVFNSQTSAMQIYQNGEFVPYRSELTDLAVSQTSVDWYRGWRGHLKFASIGNPFQKYVDQPTQ